mmetsp:Transcript_12332/g.29540  ORF Transcript_12332/g.29540 Transcript_12332/m.29540 type:complete len:90 (-) Transcript_12332:352-621(-)
MHVEWLKPRHRDRQLTGLMSLSCHVSPPPPLSTHTQSRQHSTAHAHTHTHTHRERERERSSQPGPSTKWRSTNRARDTQTEDMEAHTLV